MRALRTPRLPKWSAESRSLRGSRKRRRMPVRRPAWHGLASWQEQDPCVTQIGTLACRRRLVSEHIGWALHRNLQAAGRVIRTQEDEAVVYLIDDRIVRRCAL